MTYEEVKRLLNTTGDPLSDSCQFTSVPTCWPIGFTWSSFVAQSTMVSVATETIFKTEQLLTDVGSLPEAGLLCLSIATDDVVCFTRASHEEALSMTEFPLHGLDAAWERKSIKARKTKSTTCEVPPRSLAFY